MIKILRSIGQNSYHNNTFVNFCQMKGKLVLIVGPSGVGKGTVIKAIRDKHPEFVYPVSCTTRVPRPGEKEGVVYHYITRADFEAGIQEGRFLEYALVHSDNYYGTMKQPIISALKAEKTVVREIDIQGFQEIRKQLSKENLVSIFLYVRDWETLKRRIVKRNPENEHAMEMRRKSFEREMALRHLCDYQVESHEGEIPECIEEVERIILEVKSQK